MTTIFSTTQTKWNERYQDVHVPNQVIEVLNNNQHLLPEGGKSLDLACGLGGNALRLAELGFESHAWDISDIGLLRVNEFAHERKLKIITRQCDISSIEQQKQLAKEKFDVIIVSRFLLREMIPLLITALNPGGVIFYQTFVQVNEQDNATEQPSTGPKNALFRLQRNELLNLFSSLTLRYYREDGISSEQADEAMLVAQKL